MTPADSAPAPYHPDDFMFRQFERHARILRTPRRRAYFMYSSGANLLRAPDIWTTGLMLEMNHALAYTWYTPAAGFPLLTNAVTAYHRWMASGKPSVEPGCLRASRAVMTFGATQAARAVFDYIASTLPGAEVLMVGGGYPLFARLARFYGLPITDLLEPDADPAAESPLAPAAEAVLEHVRLRRPALTVLTVPTNPAGVVYPESFIHTLCRAVGEYGGLVLIDEVGQLTPFDPRWVNLPRLVADSGVADSIVLINSFSKSDSVPGFRIGYLFGPPPIADHAARMQFAYAMNPQTIPALGPFLALTLRSMPSADDLIAQRARRIFELTTAIADPNLIAEVDRLLGPELVTTHTDYKQHLTAQLDTMALNYDILTTTLAFALRSAVRPGGGFNCVFMLDTGNRQSEDEFCAAVFHDTAVALLTESCFRLTPPSRSPGKFWIRASLAAPTDIFTAATERLACHLRKEPIEPSSFIM
jgi:aspartate/methionine/tyrosine aminotransferase